METIDLFRAKEDTERAARYAWDEYTKLVQNNGTGEERLTALRAAIQADTTYNNAYRDWRQACGVGW